MKLVTWEEFYAYVGPRDIVLNTQRTVVIWQTRNQVEVGGSTPGWNLEGPKTYSLTEAAYRELKGGTKP